MEIIQSPPPSANWIDRNPTRVTTKNNVSLPGGGTDTLVVSYTVPANKCAFVHKSWGAYYTGAAVAGHLRACLTTGASWGDDYELDEVQFHTTWPINLKGDSFSLNGAGAFLTEGETISLRARQTSSQSLDCFGGLVCTVFDA